MANSRTKCAIYTRKSTDEGLEKDFNTLDAQREAAEACILSQKDQGWMAVPQHFDDGGYTGGNLERPALQRLLQDIRQGVIDCVVVYKVDRLSRSLTDFAKLMEIFEQYQVAFVAVTQQINTASSAGRLMLNVLLSFAQFERELIAERTRDKMGAARRKGKWLGSAPVLGYDADREARRLTVNPDEARRVKRIFEWYLEHSSLRHVVNELRRQGWRNKVWRTKAGELRGGSEFTKATLRFLLTNITYLGMVRNRHEIYLGEHDAIVAEELFEQVQDKLAASRQSPLGPRQRIAKSLLQGRLFCAGCQRKMTHTRKRKGKRVYRYYVCAHPDRQCGNSIPALEMEDYVRQQVETARGNIIEAGYLDWLDELDRVSYHPESGDLQIAMKPVDQDDARTKKPELDATSKSPL